MRDYTSWSEIDTIRHCLKKHDYRYKQGWTGPAHPAAELGTRWHTMLEALYTVGDPSAPIEVLKRWKGEDGPTDEIDTLTWMLEGYYEHWGLGDPMWNKIEFVEAEFEVPLPDVGNGELILKGVVDLGVWINRKLWVVDHKTSTTQPKPRDFEMADQWTLYVWALRKMGYEVFGSVHNFARTEKLKRKMSLEERYSRTPIHRTEREVEQVAREAALQAWLGRSDNGAPRSPGEMCFRRCGFFNPCLADRRFSEGLSDNIMQVSHIREKR